MLATRSRRSAGRAGSVAVKKRVATTARWSALVDHGDPIPFTRGRPTVGLLNANPFSYGIANLGAQTIAGHLIERDVNVLFGFADTMNVRPFLNHETAQAADCDLIALSVPFEDTYLNVPRMLERLGLPVLARERRRSGWPLVIGGGLAMINPLPLASFFDAIVIGEGRDALLSILDHVAGRPRDSRNHLEPIAHIPGVYVPELYEIAVDERGRVTNFAADGAPEHVESNVVLPMDEHPLYSNWTSRFAAYEQDDYFSVMAAMGCHKKCPFCVVGHVQGARSGRAMAAPEDVIVDLAEDRRARYGTNLVKLFFSSAFSPGGGDIESAALKSVLAELRKRRFSCRVGSLNVRQADEELFALLADVGQTEVTFAPETTERLRRRLGKTYIIDSKLHDLAELAGRHGLDLNIYALGSIPGEPPDEIDDFAALLCRLRRCLGPKRAMRMHYNPAFMKAQTPYQFFATARPEEMRAKLARLRAALAAHHITVITVIDNAMAYYQPVLAMGDDRSARVIMELYRTATVTEKDWRDAFTRLGYDDERYFTARGLDERLPWEHIGYQDHAKLRRRAKLIADLAHRDLAPA